MQIDMRLMVRHLQSCAAANRQNGPEEYIRKLLGRCVSEDICFSEIDCEAFDEEDLDAFMKDNAMERVERIVDVIDSIKPAHAVKRMFF